MVKCGRGPGTVTELGGESIRENEATPSYVFGALSTVKIGTMRHVNLMSLGPHSTGKKQKMEDVYHMFESPHIEENQKIEDNSSGPTKHEKQKIHDVNHMFQGPHSRENQKMEDVKHVF